MLHTTVSGSLWENPIPDIPDEAAMAYVFDIVFFLECHLGDPSVWLCHLSDIRLFGHQVSKKTIDMMVWCCDKTLQR